MVKEGKYNQQNITVNHGRAGSVTGINALYGSTVNLGENNQENMWIDTGSVEHIYGIYSASNSEVDGGEREKISIIQNGGSSNNLAGVFSDSNGKINFGDNSSNHIEINRGIAKSVAGIVSMSKSVVDIGKNSVLSFVQNDGSSSSLDGIYATLNSAVDIGKDSTLSIIQNGGTASTIYGLETYDHSTISAADGLRVSIDSTGNAANSVYGVYNYSKSHMTVGNDSTISAIVKNTSQETKNSVVSGMRNILSDSSFGNNLHVQVQADNYETAEGIRNTGVDAAKATMKIGDNLSVAVKASELSGGGAPAVEGIRNGTNHVPGYTFTDGNTVLTVGKDAHISVLAPDKVTDVSALHSFNYANAKIGDGAVLTVNSNAKNSKGSIINNVVKTNESGYIAFDGGMTLAGTQNAIYSTDDGSSVTAMGNGHKVILGDLESANKGSIKLNLNTGDSLFRGKSTVTGGDTELTLANSARWDMTASSQLTKLTHENGGVVNMAYNHDLQQLDVDTYSSNGGIFHMKSDLNELETVDKLHADKVYIDKSAEGSTGLIQVHDQSFLTGHEVTGTKYQLLVTDKSGKAKFSGLDLDDGGLWDVTPTIQRGNTVKDASGNTVGDDTQWYLTKLEKSINKDTKPLIGAADYAYGSYRMDIDTLRQRMGDLRFLKNRRDAAGIWARSYDGELDGPGYDSQYHAIQVGYDYAANDKSLYGFLGERGIASPHYDYGHSKDHSLAGAIYGTWFGDSGSYTDVVAKWGRDDSNLHTYGPYADSANFRTSSESLSVEYGKTTKLNGHGLFIEPQAQLVLGRLNDKDFTTARGKMVHLGSYDSAIGRLGFVFGQRRPDAAKPYDYYLKASVLHEFGGSRSFHLAAPDGETMDLTNHYGSTWYEAGFGGTYRVNHSTYLYADAERSFGSDWQKKWQANVGINWQF